MSKHLSDFIKIRRRYTRSVNLERDQDIADSVKGYILSPNNSDLISRFITSLEKPQSVRAWTLTGVYGTGKSAFAHFLLALCSPSASPIRKNAERILRETKKQLSPIKSNIPDRGLIKAVATAQREPIVNTLVRAVSKGALNYWQGVRGVRPKSLDLIRDLERKLHNDEFIDNRKVIQVIQELAIASKNGIVIVIDELGKNLEYVSQAHGNNDLYFLQQLAEIPSGHNDPKVFFIGLLHQAFSDYAHSLTLSQRNEWSKIQGRFEDIPFSESSERMLHLIGSAIEQSEPGKKFPGLKKQAISWHAVTSEFSAMRSISAEDIASVFPFHPFSAYVLPLLCSKYSQNDRTLFTFLSSAEPHSFASFLNGTAYDSGKMLSLKLYHLYDYFIESAGLTGSSLPQHQKWVEIQGRISDARGLKSEDISVLKTIGILNLVANTGSLRASRRVVTLALCDNSENSDERNNYENTIDSLIERGFVTWRKQIDELRIWEGTDFDIDSMLDEQLQQIRLPLAQMLNEHYPLRPIIANKHSYITGTLRYFERLYVDGSNNERLNTVTRGYDGRICYWVDSTNHPQVPPAKSSDGKPIVLVAGINLETLTSACLEFVALAHVEKTAVQLQTDGVARREVRQRQFIAKKILEDTLANSFDFKNGLQCFAGGSPINIHNDRMLNARLSVICDEVYEKGLKFWNELLNKRELTSQAVKARRELIEAMLKNIGQKRLGIQGYGPEFCMFQTLLIETGIYVYAQDSWTVNPPRKDSGVYEAWKKIEDYCITAVESPKKMSSLYDEIDSPPYGVRQGAIPIILLSVFLCHSEYLSIYYDGTYVPVIGADHFELLMRQPQKFSVKYLKMAGLKAEVVKELEHFIYDPIINKKLNVRNATLLSMVNPLIKFVRKLPQCSLKTESISKRAQLVRKAILEAREPDKLLFETLPLALDMDFFDTSQTANNEIAKKFTKLLRDSLQEMGLYYENILAYCRKLLHEVFSIGWEKQNLRMHIEVRADGLKGRIIEPFMKRFVIAATDRDSSDTKWLEALVMIIADKPAESWADDDKIAFETRLADLARRFKNLEAIQKQGESMRRKGFDACRISVTRPSGEEINEVVWLDHGEAGEIRKLAQRILAGKVLEGNEKFKKAIIAAMVEEVFGNEEPAIDQEIDSVSIEEKKSA